LIERVGEFAEGGEGLVGDGFVGERPEVFGRLEFRGVGRQEAEPDAVGNLQLGRAPMTSDTSPQPISPLRARMIEDMTVHGFNERTRGHYVRHVRVSLRSPCEVR
jgi:hypothetical protein